MNSIWIWISGGFILGLMSSAHCLGMCGPLAILVGTKLGGTEVSSRKRFWLTMLAATGKAFTYSLIGLAFGFAGALLSDWSRWMKLSHLFPVIASAILIITGLGLIGIFPRLELRLKPVETFLFSSFRKNIPDGQISGAFVSGMLWGFLPCPMVLVPALAAAVSGGAAGVEGAMRGFFMMLAFGAGTFPAIVSSAYAGSLIRFNLGRWAQFAAGMALIFLGIGSIYFSKMH